jgi:photosystem II stability/assembly factor-like uncharacterized protein
VLFRSASCGRRLLAVGELGLIATSGDDGKTWSQAPSPTSVMLTSVSCASQHVAWAVGHDGVILATADAGAHWTKQADGAAINQQVLAAAEAQHKRAAADRTRLEHAQDVLADARAAVKAGPSRPLLSVRVVDARTVYAAGSYGQLLRTSDAGKTWTYIGDRLPNPTGLHLHSIALGANGALYIAAEAGVVFRSRDQGQSWTRSDLGYRGNLYGVLATPEAIVAYGFRGHLFRSADDGTTWQPIASPSDQSLIHGAVLAGGRIVLATQAGELLASANGARSFTALPRQLALRQLGSFTLNASQDAVIAVGAGGVASHTLEKNEP